MMIEIHSLTPDYVELKFKDSEFEVILKLEEEDLERLEGILNHLKKYTKLRW